MISQWIIQFLQLGEKSRVKRGKMHISLHVPGAAAFASIINKALPGKSTRWAGQAGALLPRKQKQKTKTGPLFSKSASSLLWTDGRRRGVGPLIS